MSKVHYTKVFVLVLLVGAAFLRLWRINELTEFLGDQGRTGMIIYESWKSWQLPLVGPPVLTGQFLGPAFYYLIGLPFILGGFHPIVPSIFMAMLGVLSVFFLYRLAASLFGTWIGIAVAGLYAVSPSIVRADRTIWEPTAVPLFVLLYLWCVYSVFEKRRYWYLLPMGAIVGVLIQLHYPNIFYVGLSVGLLLLLLVRKKTPKKSVLLWFLAGIAGFLLVLSPFLWYESQHAWIDIREIVLILVFGGAGGQASYSYSERMVDASYKLFGHLAPEASKRFILTLQLFVLAAVFWRRTFWSAFLAGWYVLGIAAIALYRGVVFDHYLFFLLPLAYLLLGHAAWALRTYIPIYIIIGFIGLLVVANVRKTDIFLPGPNDISRVQGIVAEIRRSVKDQPFSFTLTSSRSFSDLHYRYFFKLAEVEPKPVTDVGYNTLFLICDQFPCSSKGEMKKKIRVQAICFERHCKGSYPSVDLSDWELKATLYAPDGRIYMFRIQ